MSETVIGTADDISLKAAQMAPSTNPTAMSGLLSPAAVAARNATLASYVITGANFIVFAGPTTSVTDTHRRAGLRIPVSGIQVAIAETSLGATIDGALQISEATMAILQADPALRIVLADPIS